jgi:parallel beta-helix repeat protein
VEECQSLDHHDLGLHPGSGSQRPIIRGNTIRNCRIGLFWCWGVQYGIAEDNAIYGSREYGISIGHRDTDNRLRNNQVYNSGKAGLYFRPEEPPIRCPHRNLVEENLFEDADIGIDMEGAVEGVVLRENHIVDTKGTMKAGLRIGEHVTDLTLKDNAFQGIQRPVVDLRAGVSG